MSGITVLLVRVLLLVLAGFLPSLIYLILIRNTEKFNREPWGMVLSVFARGAFYSVIIAMIFELIFYFVYKVQIERMYLFLKEHPVIEGLVMACVVAPFVEELAKLSAVTRAKFQIDEFEDGFIYGAAAGLGFAATENILYEWEFALAGDFESFALLVFVRGISSTILHASASGIAGYGLGCIYLRGRYGTGILMLLTAMGLHALFNLLASLGAIFGDLWYSGLIGLGFSIALAFLALGYVRGKIKQLDAGTGYK
ncbi:MAG: PrsW family intramembrane metalloprotease [Thermoplasmata archaeon]|nr:PrsW family intramembrane metalloprotease [Thermoplasmata archaeon]